MHVSEPVFAAASLAAPFPYFGGKRAVADLIWTRLGDVRVYVEPFAGSLSVLLLRPHAPRVETVNDLDGHIANVWRSIRADPERVASYADDIVSEVDLHSRHALLVRERATLTERLLADPDYYDARLAGWWVWGASCWIGSGWCSGRGPWQVAEGRLMKQDGEGIERKRPHLMTAGKGVQRKVPQVGDFGRGVHKQLPHLGDACLVPHRPDGAITDWLAALAGRLRRVRVCCGDWRRVLGPAGTTHVGLTGVFLDPPYSHVGRDGEIYTHDEVDTFRGAREWAIQHGGDPRYRIVLCGYAEDDPGAQMPPCWTHHAWKTRGGYGNQGTGRGRLNAGREVLWFSPHCLEASQPSLFEVPRE